MKELDLEKKSIKGPLTKKKAKVALTIFGTMIFGVLFAFLIYANKNGAFVVQQKSDADEAIDSPTAMSEVDYKENMIISLENKLDKVEEKMSGIADVVKKENEKLFEKQNLLIDKRFKEESIKQQSVLQQSQEEILSMREKFEQLENNMQVFKKTAENKINLKIQEVDQGLQKQQVLLPPPVVGDSSVNTKLLLPPKLGQKKSTASNTYSSQDEVNKVFTFSTITNGDVVKSVAKEAALEADAKKQENASRAKSKRFEIATGFTKAYMITGAYGPLFGASELGSVPILFEAQEDILISNDYSLDIDKCFFMGGGIGDPATESVIVKITKMQCIFANKTKQVTMDLEGWVLDKTGKPGVKGTLINKSGQYITRMIGAGIFEGLGEGFVNWTNTLGTNNSDSGTNTIFQGAASGGGDGMNNAFSKLADFYLKMAEKTLPVIEAKGGREVTIMLKGGSNVSVTPFNGLDVSMLDFEGEKNENNN